MIYQISKWIVSGIPRHFLLMMRICNQNTSYFIYLLILEKCKLNLKIIVWNSARACTHDTYIEARVKEKRRRWWQTSCDRADSKLVWYSLSLTESQKDGWLCLHVTSLSLSPSLSLSLSPSLSLCIAFTTHCHCQWPI